MKLNVFHFFITSNNNRYTVIIGDNIIFLVYARYFLYLAHAHRFRIHVNKIEHIFGSQSVYCHQLFKWLCVTAAAALGAAVAGERPSTADSVTTWVGSGVLRCRLLSHIAAFSLHTSVSKYFESSYVIFINYTYTFIHLYVLASSLLS